MYKSFKFKSLYIDLEKKRLIVNGKELPFTGISDFLLESHDTEIPGRYGRAGYWNLEIKRNLVWDAAECVISPDDLLDKKEEAMDDTAASLS